MYRPGYDPRIALAEQKELLAEADRWRRFPKTRVTLAGVVLRWVLVLAAISALVALWIITKPGS